MALYCCLALETVGTLLGGFLTSGSDAGGGLLVLLTVVLLLLDFLVNPKAVNVFCPVNNGALLLLRL